MRHAFALLAIACRRGVRLLAELPGLEDVDEPLLVHDAELHRPYLHRVADNEVEVEVAMLASDQIG